MKLADIVGGKVVIHPDMLIIPAFKRIWEKYDENKATKYISYIVLRNHPSSPYVKSMYAADIESRLKTEIFGNTDTKLSQDVLDAEKAYQGFTYTLTLGLLKNIRKKLETISKWYSDSLEDALDEDKVNKILSGIAKVGDTLKSVDALERAVTAEEMNTNKVRGGGEINPFELA